MMKKLYSALILILCVCLCASLCLAENEELPVVECEGISGSFPWLTYELTVKNVRLNEPEKTFEVCFLAAEDVPIPTTEMTVDNLKLITLKDAAGETVPPVSFRYWGVTFDMASGKFGDAETQEGFILVYSLPAGGTDGLTLALEGAPET